jgi:Zn-dependent protease/CBS domain-containing protein
VLSNSVRLFTVRGIEVGVHYSWLIIFALVTWSLADSLFPAMRPGLSTVDYWVTGAVGSLLLLVSVLLHELAHSFVALNRGLQAKSITLFIFGGVSNLAGEAKSASTEFLVAIVGPLTSFVIAGVSFAVAALVNEPHVELLANYMWFVNLSLGIFNLIPGFPLDGGRVLRAILWGATGDVRRSTEWAANGGKLVAYLMFGIAIWLFLNGDAFQGIWIAAIAWFLHNAASSSVQQLVFETRLRKVRAGDIVRRDDETAAPGITVAELVDQYLLPGNRRAVAVTDNGRLVGIVTVTDVQRVPLEERNRVTVAEVMTGGDRLVTVRADQRVQGAVELLAARDLGQVPVVDNGRLVGLLTRADVMRQLQLREALDI